MVIRWTLFIENNWNKNIKENNSKFLKRILHHKNNQGRLAQPLHLHRGCSGFFLYKPFAFTETFTNFAYKYEDSISYEREESYEIEKTY